MTIRRVIDPIKRSVRNIGLAIGAVHIALVVQLAVSTAYRQILGGSVLALLLCGLLVLADASIFINGALNRHFRGSGAARLVGQSNIGMTAVITTRLFAPQLLSLPPRPAQFTVWYVPLLVILWSDTLTVPVYLRRIPRHPSPASCDSSA